MSSFRKGELRRLGMIAAMTQFELKQATGISQSTLSMAEAGLVQLTEQQEEGVRNQLLRRIAAQVAAANRVLREAQRQEEGRAVSV